MTSPAEEHRGHRLAVRGLCYRMGLSIGAAYEIYEYVMNDQLNR
jgi:hypothetical protein